MKDSYIKIKNGEIEVKLLLEISNDGDTFLISNEALKLSTYGSNDEDPVTIFEDALNIFLEETLKQKTLEHELINLGWTLQPDLYSKHTEEKPEQNSKYIVFEKILANPVCYA